MVIEGRELLLSVKDFTRILELLFIDNNLLNYIFVKKKNDNFHITNLYGDEKQKDKISMTIESIFKQNLNSIDYERIFYYSIEGNKEDINLLSSIDSDKITLINPLKKLTFDDINLLCIKYKITI